MRARTLVAVLTAAALLLAACKGDKAPTPPPADGSLAATATTLGVDPSPEPTNQSSTTTSAGAAVTSPGAPPAPTTSRPVAPGAATTEDPKTAAQTALDAFLDGLQAEDYQGAIRASADGPRLLAFVRSLLKALNQQAGATSTFTYAERRYTPAAVTAERVVLTGKAVLRQTTVTKTGERQSTEVDLGEAAVVLRSGRWYVAELVWEGKPVEFTPSSAEAELSQGVKARLAGVVRFGSTAAVVVGFQTDKNLAVRIEKDRLRGGGYDNASTFRALVNGYGLFNYVRKGGVPRTWTAEIAVKPDPARPVSMAFG